MLRDFDLAAPVVIEGDYIVIIVVKVRNFIIVAVRGTAKIYDWVYNLNITPKFCSVGNRKRLIFHRGFYAEMRKHQKDLVKAVRSAAHSDSELYFTGHSLGGAIAGLYNAFWNDDIRMFTELEPPAVPKSSGAYTFGMPRFASWRSVSDLRTPYHVRRQGDGVPNVPPSALGFGACPDEFWPTGEPAARSGVLGLVSYAAWIHSLNALNTVSNHSMEKYRKDIASTLGIPSPDKLLPYDRSEWPGGR